MGSENPSGADNQQETAVPCLVLDPNWIAGFVDGEGCFSVSVHRSSMMDRHGGWQLQPVFHIYQHQDHRDVLEAMVPTFGCGRIRPKGPRSSVLTFSVEALRDLESAVIPFFEQHRLIVKSDDFEAFAAIVRSMRKKEHLTRSGFERLVRLAYGMNANGKQRSRSIEQVLAGSSETAREALQLHRSSLPTGIGRSKTKIQSDPHGDMGSQAEMIWPLMR
jgi:hypothetical protein